MPPRSHLLPVAHYQPLLTTMTQVAQDRPTFGGLFADYLESQGTYVPPTNFATLATLPVPPAGGFPTIKDELRGTKRRLGDDGDEPGRSKRVRTATSGPVPPSPNYKLSAMDESFFLDDDDDDTSVFLDAVDSWHWGDTSFTDSTDEPVDATNPGSWDDPFVPQGSPGKDAFRDATKPDAHVSQVSEMHFRSLLFGDEHDAGVGGTTYETFASSSLANALGDSNDPMLTWPLNLDFPTADAAPMPIPRYEGELDSWDIPPPLDRDSGEPSTNALNTAYRPAASPSPLSRAQVEEDSKKDAAGAAEKVQVVEERRFRPHFPKARCLWKQVCKSRVQTVYALHGREAVRGAVERWARPYVKDAPATLQECSHHASSSQSVVPVHNPETLQSETIDASSSSPDVQSLPQCHEDTDDASEDEEAEWEPVSIPVYPDNAPDADARRSLAPSPSPRTEPQEIPEAPELELPRLSSIRVKGLKEAKPMIPSGTPAGLLDERYGSPWFICTPEDPFDYDIVYSNDCQFYNIYYM